MVVKDELLIYRVFFQNDKNVSIQQNVKKYVARTTFADANEIDLPTAVVNGMELQYVKVVEETTENVVVEKKIKKIKYQIWISASCLTLKVYPPKDIEGVVLENGKKYFVRMIKDSISDMVVYNPRIVDKIDHFDLIKYLQNTNNRSKLSTAVENGMVLQYVKVAEELH